MDNDWRNARIEEVAATIAVAELVRTHRTWGDLIEPQKDEYRRVARAVLAVFEKAHTPTDDEREALADRLARRLIDDPKQLMLAEGTGALHVALSDSIRSVIEDVYADCGDSDPGVLSSNIARRLAGDLPSAILADPGFRRSEVLPEPSAEDYESGKLRALGGGESEALCLDCRGELTSWFCDRCSNTGLIKREPQGEPSGALPIWERPEAIEAARLAYQEAFEADYDAEDCIAFALRAAGEVR